MYLQMASNATMSRPPIRQVSKTIVQILSVVSNILVLWCNVLVVVNLFGYDTCFLKKLFCVSYNRLFNLLNQLVSKRVWFKYCVPVFIKLFLFSIGRGVSPLPPSLMLSPK